MTIIQLEVSRDNLLQAIEQLDTDELSDLVSDLLYLRARRHANVLSDREAELFQQINRWLTLEEQTRRNELQKKLEAKILTEREHQELMQLNEKAEMLNAERVEALAQLATIRQTTLDQLMHDLDIDLSAHA
jgi:hypothetical protein